MEKNGKKWRKMREKWGKNICYCSTRNYQHLQNGATGILPGSAVLVMPSITDQIPLQELVCH
jgi:hypothetical protein